MIKNLLKKTFPLLIIIIFSLAWSMQLPLQNWPTDYGHHFYVSAFNDNLSIYKDFFLHKGPILVFFIDIYQNLVGIGWRESIVILFILSFIFLTTSFVVTLNVSKNYLVTFLILLYLIFFYRFQNSDIFVDLIIMPFLFLGFLFFYKFLNQKNLNLYIYLSSIFFFLATLGRIDNAIYCLLVLSFYFFYSINEKKYYLIKPSFAAKIFILNFIIFYVFAIYYNYSIIEFLRQNILFNIKYAEDDYFKFKNLGNLYAYMPYKHYAYILLIKIFYYYKKINHLSLTFTIPLIVITFLQFIFFITKYESLNLFLLIFFIEILLISILLISNRNYKNYNILLIYLLNFTSFFIFLYSGSIKLNHGMFLLFGSTIFILYFLKFFFDNTFKFNSFFTLLLIVLFLYQAEKSVRSSINPIINDNNILFSHGLTNLFYDANLIKKNSLVTLMKKENPPVVCDRGWLHIFSENKSHGLMFDWWMYDTRKKISSKKNDQFLNMIHDRKIRNYFIIDETCVKDEIFNKHVKIKKLLNNSYLEKKFILFNNKYQYRIIN